MPKVDKQQLVFDAVRRGQLADVKKFMGKKLTPAITNSSGQTPLHIACAEGHLFIVQWLTGDKKKADVDARDRDGWTPLHCACHSDHIEIVDHLIARNANVCVETGMYYNILFTYTSSSSYFYLFCFIFFFFIFLKLS